MALTLSAQEARVIGVLLEKEVTTPEIYPMTLNAITTACNQKSNREPVMSLGSSEVQTTLDTLQSKRLVMKMPGQRSVKFMQRFCSTEFSTYKLSDQERALICLLLLRGPQTPGELRTRAQRLADFNSVGEVEIALNNLAQEDRGTMVKILAREPGKRENRFITTLVEGAVASAPTTSGLTHSTQHNTAADMSEQCASPEILQISRTEFEALQDKLAQLEARIQALEGPMASHSEN